MYIKQALYFKGISPLDTDIPYIQYVLQMIEQAKLELNPYYDLPKETPIVIVDKGVIKK